MSERRTHSARTDASWAIVSQGVVAASSLVLQWLSLRSLGAKGLGEFAILSNGILVTGAAVHTGWIGDPIVVIDRHDPALRRVLVRLSALSLVASAVVGTLAAGVFAEVSWRDALIFGAAMAAWLLEETGRRILMARRQFAALTLNDAVFGIVSVGVTVAVVATRRLTMGWLVGSMLLGAIGAIALAGWQLPRTERTLPWKGPTAWRPITEFSVWRAGQLTMRPLGMLLARVAVARIVSPAALGLMEAGRLLVAPALTAANGFGGFSLPYFARKRDEGSLSMRLVARFAIASSAATALYIPLALVARGPFQHVSNSGAISLALVLTWCTYAVVNAGNIPTVNALTAQLLSRPVFWGRCVDTVIIVAGSAVVALADRVWAVPLVMSAGMVVGTVIPLVRLGRAGALAGQSRATSPSAAGLG
ncbi:MAG: hypothetical protein R2698_06295 [Microthrixaceae bacterium]